MTKTILTILIIIQIIVGTYLNQLGLIGYLPIISSVSYSLAIAITRNLQWLRWVIIENMLLWLIYDLTIQASLLPSLILLSHYYSLPLSEIEKPLADRS